jgi:hypothetical protein
VQTLLLALSAAFLLIAPITYIISIFKGRTKPHRMTRFILFFVTALNFISILVVNGNIGANVFAGIMFAQSAVIFFLSLWRGVGGTTKLDWTCLTIAILGVVMWKLTGNPVMGILFSILADLAAYIPAFLKTWKHPSTETPWYYVAGTISAVLSLVAYKIELVSLFQIYIIAANMVMFICIYHKGIPKVNRN